MKSTGISESVLLNIKTVFSNYPEVEKVVLFGSRAKGNFMRVLILTLPYLEKS